MTHIGITLGLSLMEPFLLLVFPNRLVLNILVLLEYMNLCFGFGFLRVSKSLHVGFILQVILINGQFPGPRLDVVTNDNIVLNLINKLDQPFLLTW